MSVVEDVEELPSHRAAALKVVQLVDDPTTSASEVADGVALDPALTARILQVANSAYFGLSGRVRTTSFAVTVVGFQTVRSLAALAAAGVTQDDPLPRGFWQRSAAAASGASLLASRVGATSPDAFCVGMLHDLGTVLLWRRDPALHESLAGRAEPLVALELQTYGTTHAAAGADVLEAWNVPTDLCAAIRRHHDQPSSAAAPLRRALQAGIALGALIEGDRDPVHRVAVTAAGVRDDELPVLLSQVEEAQRQLAAVLSA